MFKNLMTIEEVASVAKLSVGTIYNFAWSGDLPPPRVKFGSRCLFAKEDIRFWLRSRVDRRKFNGGKKRRR